MKSQTARTRPVGHYPLTASETKEVINLLAGIQENFASGPSVKDRRYIAHLEKIKGKLRRGF